MVAPLHVRERQLNGCLSRACSGHLGILFCRDGTIRYFCSMGKTYFSKNDFRKRKALYDEIRKKVAEGNGISEAEASLSTLDRQYEIIMSAEHALSRHPQRTKAEGLRKDYTGRRIHWSRRRFGEVEEKSSRMRILRRSVKHAARLRAKRELESTASEAMTDEK